jgi:hypothetical protein
MIMAGIVEAILGQVVIQALEVVRVAVLVDRGATTPVITLVLMVKNLWIKKSGDLGPTF